MPTMVEAGPTNTYMPGWDTNTDATGQIVHYMKDPKNFRFNEYCAFRPALRMAGIYYVLDKDQPARFVSKAEYAWPDGADRPSGNQNNLPFGTEKYMTERFNIPFVVGNLTRNQAPWDLVASQGASAAQQWATLFTADVVGVLEDANNWGTHTKSADQLNGGVGYWDTSDTTLNAIQNTIYAAVEQIMLDTNSLVTMDQLRMVIGVQAAKRMRTAREITDYVKGSPEALAQVRGELPNRNLEFGLPAKLFGMDLIVENAVRVTTRKGVTANRIFIKSGNSAVIMTKQDGLPGDMVSERFATPNWSTFQVMYYTGAGKGNKDDARDTGPSGLYTVQTFEDLENERLKGHIVTNFDQKLVAPESGYLITEILSPAA